MVPRLKADSGRWFEPSGVYLVDVQRAAWLAHNDAKPSFDLVEKGFAIAQRLAAPMTAGRPLPIVGPGFKTAVAQMFLGPRDGSYFTHLEGDSRGYLSLEFLGIGDCVIVGESAGVLIESTPSRFRPDYYGHIQEIYFKLLAEARQRGWLSIPFYCVVTLNAQAMGIIEFGRVIKKFATMRAESMETDFVFDAIPMTVEGTHALNSALLHVPADIGVDRARAIWLQAAVERCSRLPTARKWFRWIEASPSLLQDAHAGPDSLRAALLRFSR